jgi:uncharacterized protein (TIGR03643 family)
MSLTRKERLKNIKPEDAPRLIKMALEDRTPFELIEVQFGLKPDDVVIFMRQNLKKASFLRWRERAHTQGRLKNPKKYAQEAERFKSPNQRIDGSIKQRYRF